MLLQAADKTDKRVIQSEIIKRSLNIVRENSDYNFLIKISDKISARNPREEFYAVLVYAYLRKGEYKQAFKYSRKYLVSRKWDPLHAEISFKYMHNIPSQYGDYTLITHNYYNNPDDLYTLAERTDNPALYLDSALLSVFTHRNQDKIPFYLQKAAAEYPLRASMISFHSFLYPLTIKIGQVDPSLFLPAVTDSFFIQDDFSGAFAYLQSFYNTELQKNWKAMFNYLWSGRKLSGKIEYSDIEKANMLFPGNPYFNLLYADFLKENGKSAQAVSLLAKIRENEQSNLVNAYYDFYLPGFSESRFISYFWNELNNKGQEMDKNLLNFYLWYFCSTGNFSDLSMALQHISDEIAYFYAGISFAFYGYYTLAETYLLHYAEKHPSWEVFYNLFLINDHIGKTSSADHYLRQAYQYYFSADTTRTENNTLLVLQTLADWEYKNGNRLQALEYLDIILQHNKTDSRAVLLRDQILQEGE